MIMTLQAQLNNIGYKKNTLSKFEGNKQFFLR
ncbi:hypothetical protein CQZ91_01645 [Bacillus cereus]|nr:hypothetical protein CQZ92_01645 [Bacillus cereus]PRD06006.1 hypothetical protein CQZ91_01645 [Bacillus cereus]